MSSTQLIFAFIAFLLPSPHLAFFADGARKALSVVGAIPRCPLARCWPLLPLRAGETCLSVCGLLTQAYLRFNPSLGQTAILRIIFFFPWEMGVWWCCSHRAAGALAARAQGKAGSPIAASVVLPPWPPLRAELSTRLCSGSRSRAAPRLLPGEEAETALSTGSQTEGASPQDGPAAFGPPAVECRRKRPAGVAPCARPTCLPH